MRSAGLKTKSKGYFQKRLLKEAKVVLRRLRKSGAAVEVVLLSDRQMEELKERFSTKGGSASGEKKHKKIIDVLAFPEPREFPRPASKKALLGEVYINWDAYHNDPEYLVYLLIHGILHLAGYDHKQKRDRIKMEALEDKLLSHRA